MTLAEALAGVEVPSVRPTMELAHRYGAELKPGMRVNVSQTAGVVELRRVDHVRTSRVARVIMVDLSDGSTVETHSDSSWYVEV